MAEYITVAKTSEIPPGSGKRINYGEISVAVFNVDGTYHAIDNTCQHAAGSLGDGTLEGEIVTCPLHMWKYNVRTGRNNTVPMNQLQTYEVRVEGDEIQVKMG